MVAFSPKKLDALMRAAGHNKVSLASALRAVTGRRASQYTVRGWVEGLVEPGFVYTMGLMAVLNLKQIEDLSDGRCKNLPRRKVDGNRRVRSRQNTGG
jgi:hypothetical protein